MGGAVQIESVIVRDPNVSPPVVKKISTTIKRKWMDRILLGLKGAELKKDSKFWHDRLMNLQGPHSTGECMIVFVCGRRVYRYWVLKVSLLTRAANIDGRLCFHHWRIDLHGRACTHPYSRYCDYRHKMVNCALQEVHFCRYTGECELEGAT